ncbi:metallophosphoesterase [Tianweitania sediminis]|uniref:Metallophosphoesterase n=1 Tax=Tianweitania sediminis TaxID=1502156 RepID=A0A8J7RGF9_9HYPH|nr:metallophosphoesterase [Tianweitania sediminis]MBP0437981.1 metallophosphoesterase [Tianweitania sediminis]
MRLWILSDLHLEYARLSQPLVVPDADVCVVAGDLCRGPEAGVRWLEEHVAGSMPCVYVAGNHEFYKGSILEGIEGGRSASVTSGRVHFLENGSASLGGITFVGATLWTDFRIEGHRLLAMAHARERMNDYRKISLRRKPWQRFLPESAARLHQDSRSFIAAALRSAGGPFVVVTHHLPLKASLSAEHEGDLLNAAYASDLSEILDESAPAVWVHGHVHESLDYIHGATRVICNPRGYADENGRFDPALVVEVPVP